LAKQSKDFKFYETEQKLQKGTRHVSSNNVIVGSSQPTGKGFNLTQEQYEQLMSLLPSTNQNIANFVGKVAHSFDTTD
jgi:hypothetical protein